jgi:hypothetical protein
MGKENRKSIRRVVRHPAMLLNDDESILGLCDVLDVSATGAKLTMRAPAELPVEFVLLLSKMASVRRRCRILWQAEQTVGVEFVVALPAKRGRH